MMMKPIKCAKQEYFLGWMQIFKNIKQGTQIREKKRQQKHLYKIFANLLWTCAIKMQTDLYFLYIQTLHIYIYYIGNRQLFKWICFYGNKLWLCVKQILFWTYFKNFIYLRIVKIITFLVNECLIWYES